ncbi:MAG: transcriptional repressor [Desulfobacteraceae bacterium]|nr:transcriptional repressor [Desulfobacteraceae bacterium]
MKNSNKKQAQSLANFKIICQDAGVKCTQQRMKIYSELIQNPNHPDAETVYKKVQNQLANISLDTVYRTLWLFKDIGLITTIGPSRERTRFDPNLKPHHHFICTECGLILDFNSEQMDTLDIHESIKMIGKAGSLQVNIQGICRGCEINGKIISD